MQRSNDNSALLGVGLDNNDGHKRVTKGDNFYLVGGSEETHERMTETAVKFNEKLSRKGKRINDLSPEEFRYKEIVPERHVFTHRPRLVRRSLGEGGWSVPESRFVWLQRNTLRGSAPLNPRQGWLRATFVTSQPRWAVSMYPLSRRSATKTDAPVVS